jgi:hypothetical protein
MSGQRGEIVPERLARHLESWLGTCVFPGSGRVSIVGSSRRTEPGWDGTIRRFVGVETLSGAILSVAPDRVGAVRALGDDLDTIGSRLAEALETPASRFGRGIFRWTEHPTPPRPDRLGIWLPIDDPVVPPWLHPFNGDVLVGFADPNRQVVAAGVGRKQHDQHGHELAVVTEEGFRGLGWARSLVAQAAARVLADGAIPTYFHAPDNLASAATADAAGFPDLGWRILGLFP